MPIITLDGLDGATELSSNIKKEVGQGSEGVRFKLKGKSPKVMSKIIKNDQIILRTGHTNNQRCPKIKMN
jgi:selenocysteine lyase/cysteine desulfurase